MTLKDLTTRCTKRDATRVQEIIDEINATPRKPTMYGPVLLDQGISFDGNIVYRWIDFNGNIQTGKA